jgi:hypothetical protein
VKISADWSDLQTAFLIIDERILNYFETALLAKLLAYGPNVEARHIVSLQLRHRDDVATFIEFATGLQLIWEQSGIGT